MRATVFRYRYPNKQNTLFLDRDGVLIHPVLRGDHVGSARQEKDIRMCNDFEGLNLPDIVKNWNLVIITNQPDVSYGHIDMVFVERIGDLISTLIPINVMYVCPHEDKDKCECRKPNAGMIKQYHNDYPEIIGKEFLVGDTDKDYGCAENAGIPFILRKRSYNTDLVPFADYYINTLRGLGDILGK